MADEKDTPTEAEVTEASDQPAQEEEAAAPKSGKPKFNEMVVVKLFDKVLDFAGNLLSLKFLESNLKWAGRLGHFGLLIAAVVGLLTAMILAVKANSFYAFLAGIGWVFLVLVLQYVAARFSDASNVLIQSTPSQMSSAAFLDCVALLNIIAGVLLFVNGIITAVQGKSIEAFLTGLGILILCEFWACVSLHPKCLNMEISEEATAGEEAIGILSFFMKGAVTLVPIAFGVGVVLGTIGLAFAGVSVLVADAAELFAAQADAMKAGTSIILAAALPFVAFVVFVVYYLTIDIIRAVLAVPHKLDALRKKK